MKADEPQKIDVLAPPPGTTIAAAAPQLEPKPNGVRDLQFWLVSLRDVELQQVMVTCQTDERADDLAARHHRVAGLALGRPAVGDRDRPPTSSWSRRSATPSRRTSPSTSPTRTASRRTSRSRPTSTPNPNSPSTPRHRPPPGPASASTSRAAARSPASSAASPTGRSRWRPPGKTPSPCPWNGSPGFHFESAEPKESADDFEDRLEGRGPEDLLAGADQAGGDPRHRRHRRGDRRRPPPVHLPRGHPDDPPRTGRGAGDGRRARTRRPGRAPGRPWN